MISKLFLFISLISLTIFPRKNDSTYYLTADIGLGVNRYLSTLSMNDLNKNGLSGLIRFLWHPEYLLSAGIETGYYYLYLYNTDEINTEFGRTSARSSLISLPVILVFSMKIHDNFRINAGSGILLLFNQGEILDDKFNSSQISITDYIGLTYIREINDVLSMGGEFKYSYIFKSEDSYIALQFFISYKFLTW